MCAFCPCHAVCVSSAPALAAPAMMYVCLRPCVCAFCLCCDVCMPSASVKMCVCVFSPCHAVCVPSAPTPAPAAPAPSQLLLPCPSCSCPRPSCPGPSCTCHDVLQYRHEVGRLAEGRRVVVLILEGKHKVQRVGEGTWPTTQSRNQGAVWEGWPRGPLSSVYNRQWLG